MKTRREIVENWLPATPVCREGFGDYILLTIFSVT